VAQTRQARLRQARVALALARVSRTLR